MEAAVRGFEDRPAMDFLGRKTSYGELLSQIDRACRGLQDLGVGPGSQVGLCLPNCPYYVVAYYAALKAGATVVNFNPLYVEREMLALAQDSGISIMITLDNAEIFAKVSTLPGRTALEKVIVCPLSGALPMIKGFLHDILKSSNVARVPDSPVYMTWQCLLENDGAPDPVKLDPKTAVAVFQYTGGTTGLPKAAMLSHFNLVSNVIQSQDWFPEIRRGEERMLAVIPFFHVFAMTSAMNYGVSIGAELVLVPRFDAELVVRTIIRTRPTLFPAVPTVYSAILDVHERLKGDMSSLRFGMSGGAPLPVELKETFEQKTGCRLMEGYGLSETSPVACCNPFDGRPVKAGSVGLPVPGTTIEVRSPHDPEVIMPAGEKGEICIRGPQVMSGYWNRPEETHDSFVQGALRTGDVGYIDSEGYLFLVDRIKDVILCGGYNVYPRVIEEALYRHPAVAEAIVIGLPDDYRGEAPKAFVRLLPGTEASGEDILEFLKDHLNRIEIPREVEIRDDLPRTAVGKLSKRALREEEAALAREEERRRQKNA
ncbi:long-chain fatty acid--CoA ligase [Phaeovibrio sulfidiphilus]|uniref:Long-chain fatty acid--CoA ligase n=2 Tax=Phaeovibrio sulfidiphilus TaxID=1220600 RepID=A0A8J7CR58_9PROT|nr:long-chain fatty acid--CoA ligase [Phaeovibrio sulfidiphilus]